MWVRTLITITVWVTYLLLFNCYIYSLTTLGRITNVILLYNYITGILLLYSFLDLKAGFVSFFHEQFNTLCFLSVIVNFILIVFINHRFIVKSEEIFYLFNGLEFVVTIMILISMKRHGYFKN